MNARWKFAITDSIGDDVCMLEKPDGIIRLATFNIRHGAPHDSYQGDPDAVAEACVSLNADILALQEVDKGVRRSGKADIGLVVARATGMEPVFLPTMPFGAGEYGNALLVRGSIENPQALQLPHGYRFGVLREPRNAITARALLENAEISVVATHLSTQRCISRKQLSVIQQHLDRTDEPAVLLGDLNRRPKQVLRYISNMNLSEADPTFPASKPRKQIDHILVKGLAVQTIRTMQLPISDHRALIVDIE